MLVECPNCGPREIAELRCAGEVTRRPKDTPTVRELNEYIYFRANEAGVQLEWWFCRACEDWFLADRNTCRCWSNVRIAGRARSRSFAAPVR